MADFDPSAPSSPEEGPQREERVDLRRKVSLKFKEFQGFINEYSENVSTGGMFIRTASPQAPGTVFDFELTLGEDFKLIHGIGEVVWARDEDEGFDRPAGMGVRFLNLEGESRKLVDRIVSERLAREALQGAAGAPSRPTPDPGREEWRLDAPAATVGLPRVDEAAPEAAPEEPWWPGESMPEGAQAPSGLEPPPAPSQAPPPAPALDAGAEATLETEAPEFPRPPGPSPYAYSRSYAGSGVSRTGRRGRRPLLLVLVAAAVLVAAVAGLLLIFPEALVRLLAGGETGGETGAVATRVAGGEEGRAPEPGGAAGAPAVTPPDTGGGENAQAEPALPAEDGGGREDGAGELGFFEAPAGGEAARSAGGPSSGGERPSAQGRESTREPVPEPEPAGRAPEPPPASPAETPGPAPAPSPSGRAEAPPPEPQPAPEPGPSGFSRVLNVVWEARGDELLVTVHLDGTIREWEYSVLRVGAPPPRDLVRIRGIDRPFPRSTIPVDHPLLERVRLGFHPGERENELHLVLDLPREMVGVDRSEAEGNELRLYVAPTGGRQPPTP